MNENSRGDYWVEWIHRNGNRTSGTFSGMTPEDIREVIKNDWGTVIEIVPISNRTS